MGARVPWDWDLTPAHARTDPATAPELAPACPRSERERERESNSYRSARNHMCSTRASRSAGASQHACELTNATPSQKKRAPPLFTDPTAVHAPILSFFHRLIGKTPERGKGISQDKKRTQACKPFFFFSHSYIYNEN